jgi:hypothetical protein
MSPKHSPKELPPVERLLSATLSSNREIVQFLYLASGEPYRLDIPIDEAFKLEELFIRLRRQIGSTLPRRPL